MSKASSPFDYLAKRSLVVALLGTIFLIFPFWGLGFDVAKKFVLLAAVLVAFVGWLLGCWRERNFELGRNFTIYGLGALVLLALISALFSGTPGVSLVGVGFEHYTFVSVVFFVLLSLLVALYFRSKKDIVGLAIGVSLASLVVAAFQIIRIGLPFLFRGSINFPEVWTNLIGRWNEMGIFFGFTALLALLLLQVVKTKSAPVRKLAFISLVVSLVVLVVTNYWTVWLIVALLSLALFIYLSVFSSRKTISTVPEDSLSGAEIKPQGRAFNPILVVLIISLVFTFFGRPGGILSNAVNGFNSRLGINVLEVRPSFQGTWSVANKSIKENPIFGAGPNHFVAEWIKFRPAEVNLTDFWGVDFQTGVGYWPTLALTLGGLGVIVVIGLLLLVLWQIGRAVLARGVTDPETYSVLLLTAISTFYWWLFAAIYPLETVGLTMAFGSLGLLLAMLTVSQIDPLWRFNFGADPKLNFASTVGAVLLLVVSLGGVYLVGQKYLGIILVQRSAYALEVTGDLNKADRLATSAILIDSNEAFLRQLAIIKMQLMDRIASSQNEDQAKATADFQRIYGQAREALSLADQANKGNYLNKVLLGQLLERLVPLKVEGAYEAATTAYQEAATLNPQNPAIYLNLARLEIANDSLTKAKTYIEQALARKSNYIAAISLLSQIEADQGNLTKAIEQAGQAVTLAPNDEGARFQLGFLLYQKGNYDQAVEALNEALRLNPSFANAKYFLGLSYQEVGEKDKAIAIFEELSRLNPNNQELKDILSELRAPVKAPTKK